MGTVNIHEAKTHFSALVERVRAGEEVVIAKNGKPVARLVAHEESEAPRRELGAMRGQIWMAEDFDAPLPEDVLVQFLGGSESREPGDRGDRAVGSARTPGRKRARSRGRDQR